MRQVCGGLGDEIERLALAGEHVPFGLLETLATAYLTTRGNELAHEVRRGGQHALDRAFELITLERRERAVRVSREGGRP